MASKGLEDSGLITLFVVVGGLGGYFTNFAGMKTYIDQFLGSFVQPTDGQPPGEFPDEEPPQKQTNPPPPRKTTPSPAPFTCVSYPRCNTVTGETARKNCCCTNKCSLLGRTGGKISGNLCLCGAPKAPKTPPKPSGPCASGKYWKLVNNSWTCATCSPCATCYDRSGTGCTCKFNSNKIIHSDQYCKTLCSGISCWTNYPCPNLGARAQKCVKGSCTTARAAWLAQYGCKSRVSHVNIYKTRYGHGNFHDERLEAMPTVS